MLSTHIEKLIHSCFNEEPTPSQQQLIAMLGVFVSASGEDDAFILKGYAGTGKTSMIAAFVRALSLLKIKCVLLAPTGRAAKVLSSFTSMPAFTIHKKIYRQKTSSDGEGLFSLDRNLHTDTFFIVDEASMIANQSAEQTQFGSGQLLDDLIEYVYSGRNCRLLLSGDVAQLPPVGLDMSPALDKKIIERYGHQVTESILTDVVRQEVESGILMNATHIRHTLSSGEVSMPKLQTKGYKDIKWVSGKDVIDYISESYDKYGIEETMIVCRSNKQANIYNAGIRNKILWREEQICGGDYVMVVKNNYHWAEKIENIDFIANGDIAQVMRINKFEERYGFHFANATLRLIDYNDIEIEVKVLLDTLNSDKAAISSEENKKLYLSILEEYPEIKSKKKQFEKLRENPYFNALQIKFSYAVTCHKAQGGQWKSVFIEPGYFTPEMLSIDYLRWLYTAFTRSTKKLYLINFNKDFFPEESLMDY